MDEWINDHDLCCMLIRKVTAQGYVFLFFVTCIWACGPPERTNE